MKRACDRIGYRRDKANSEQIMKTFHWPHGGRSKTVLTVAELQELLAKYPPDMPVMAEWEGQFMPLAMSSKVESCTAGFPGEECDCLILDAEY